jgi:uncharacterized membrane protein YhaH (DUF805 family)
MNRLLRIKPQWALIVYIVLDLICVGMGMGVPFFCILFGFIVGWYIVRYITFSNTASVQQVFPKVLKYAMITSAVTLFGMLLLWVPFATYLFEPAKDLAKSGIPMILYEPKASFIAWIVLMILISPFLQLLTTLFSAYLTF